MSNRLIALVMAGGQGTRFWPESTSRKPKQYLSLVGDSPLLTQTLKRFEGLIEQSHRYVVTVKAQKELASQASDQCAAEDALIFEPSGRNTAPCILLSLVSLLKKGHDKKDVVAIVPSDHVILNEQGFCDTVYKAAMSAQEDRSITTIGITPTFPHTGFGYLHKGEETSPGVFNVAEFKEKPDFETAKSYVASGDYLWNAGMFVATIETLLEEFEACAPEVFKFYESLMTKDDIDELYNEMPADSIDYAVMEKSKRVKVVPAAFDWNDLGSWDALESVVDRQDANTIVANRAHYFENSEGNIIYTPGKHVSLIDIHDHIIISNEQSVVVMPKSKSQQVKKIVASIKEQSDLADLL